MEGRERVPLHGLSLIEVCPVVEATAAQNSVLHVVGVCTETLVRATNVRPCQPRQHLSNHLREDVRARVTAWARRNTCSRCSGPRPSGLQRNDTYALRTCCPQMLGGARAGKGSPSPHSDPCEVSLGTNRRRRRLVVSPTALFIEEAGPEGCEGWQGSLGSSGGIGNGGMCWITDGSEASSSRDGAQPRGARVRARTPGTTMCSRDCAVRA